MYLSISCKIGGFSITSTELFSLDSGTPDSSPNNGITIDRQTNCRRIYYYSNIPYYTYCLQVSFLVQFQIGLEENAWLVIIHKKKHFLV